MAGELYIADKDTLDKVNGKIDALQQSVNSINTKIINDRITVAELVYKVQQGTITQNAVTSDVNVLNLTTPGTLYYVLAGSNACNMEVTVDGTIVYNRLLSGILARSGVMYLPTATYTDGEYHFVSGSEGLGGDLVPTNMNKSNIEGIFALPKPLKFNTLKVRIYPEGSPSSSETRTVFDYYYILD